MKGFFLFLCRAGVVGLYVTSSFAQSLPENHSINGGITIIPVDLKEKPEVFYNNHRVSVTPSPNPKQWLLIVGIPLNKTEEIQQLNVKKPLQAIVPFHVSTAFYPIQSLVISNKRKVDPYEQDRERIQNEKKRLDTLFSSYTENDPYQEKFIAPSHGPISSLFGLRRIYNNQPRDPHSGLDIASPAGSPVHVISQGKVVEAADYFFTGNTVIVDHGQGLFSLYAHLNTMNVKKGDELKQGHTVGTIGQTGRVTGPHLHWSMIMNNALVDPLLFVSARDIRKLPEKKQPQGSQNTSPNT